MAGKASARKAALTEIIKRDVHDACVRVLLRDGLSAMTMEAVAREAEVAKGTLYNYFKNKRDLLEYVHITLFETVRRRMDEVAAADLPGRDKLLRMIDYIVDEFDQNREILQLTVAEFGVHPLSSEIDEDPLHQYFLALYERLAREALRDGALKSIPPRVLARFLHGLILGLLTQRADLAHPRSAQKDIRDFLTVLLRDPG